MTKPIIATSLEGMSNSSTPYNMYKPKTATLYWRVHERQLLPYEFSGSYVDVRRYAEKIAKEHNLVVDEYVFTTPKASQPVHPPKSFYIDLIIKV